MRITKIIRHFPLVNRGARNLRVVLTNSRWTPNAVTASDIRSIARRRGNRRTTCGVGANIRWIRSGIIMQQNVRTEIGLHSGGLGRSPMIVYCDERSEERRVGKECRSRWSPYDEKKREERDREVD